LGEGWWQGVNRGEEEEEEEEVISLLWRLCGPFGGCENWLRILFIPLLLLLLLLKTNLFTAPLPLLTLFKKLPASAPPIVRGSMMRMRSQSTRGRSAEGCLGVHHAHV
jgi:hypothetical protein